MTTPDDERMGVNAERTRASEKPRANAECYPDPVPSGRAPIQTDEPSVLVRPPREARSQTLPSGWFNPMPGGYVGGYAADTGLDIAGFRLEVFAVAAGTVVYAEPGHTGWQGPGNTNLSVLIELDEPVAWRGRMITHAWYAHLSELAFEQPEHGPRQRHVVGGTKLGTSGFGNGSPHLHLGLLLDDGVEQKWGDYLPFDQVAELLGPYRLRDRLPR